MLRYDILILLGFPSMLDKQLLILSSYFTACILFLSPCCGNKFYYFVMWFYIFIGIWMNYYYYYYIILYNCIFPYLLSHTHARFPSSSTLGHYELSPGVLVPRLLDLEIADTMGLGSPCCPTLVPLFPPVNSQDSEDLNQGIWEALRLMWRLNQRMYQLSVNGFGYRPGPQDTGLSELDSEVLSITECCSNSDSLIWQLQQPSHLWNLHGDHGWHCALSPSLLGWSTEFC